MKKKSNANGFPGGGPVMHPDDGLGFGSGSDGVSNSMNMPANHSQNFDGPWSGNTVNNEPFSNRSEKKNPQEKSVEEVIDEIKALIKADTRESRELAKHLKEELDVRVRRLKAARRVYKLTKTAEQTNIKDLPFTKALFVEHNLSTDSLDQVNVDWDTVPADLLHYALHDAAEFIKGGQSEEKPKMIELWFFNDDKEWQLILPPHFPEEVELKEEIMWSLGYKTKRVEVDDIEHTYRKASPKIKTLKTNKKPLTDEERKKVMDAGAVWHHGPGGAKSPAVWKAEVKGKTWYVCNTHRAYQCKDTLAKAIKAFDFIQTTAQTAQPIKGKCPKSDKWVYLSQSDMVQQNYKADCPEGKVKVDKLKKKKPVSVKEYTKKKKKKKKKGSILGFIKEAGLPEKIELLKKKYDKSVRDNALRFIASPGHQDDDLEEVVQKYFDRHIGHAIDEDPTSKKKYLEWVFRMLTSGRRGAQYSQMYEEGEIYDLLKRFEAAKGSNKISKDINSYKSLKELYDAVEEVEGGGYQRESGKDAPVLLDQPPYRVIRLDSYKASAKLCKGTQWCVRAPNMYERYSKDGPLYLIQKDGKPYVMAHYESGQFMDVDDIPLEKSELTKMVSMLEPVTHKGLEDLIKAAIDEVEDTVMYFLRKRYLGPVLEGTQSVEQAIYMWVDEMASTTDPPPSWSYLLDTEEQQSVVAEMLRSPKAVQKIKDLGLESQEEVDDRETEVVAHKRFSKQAQQTLQFSSEEEAIFDKVKESAEAVGVQVYLVGGSIRDRLIGKESHDLDFMVEGDEQAAEKLVTHLGQKYNLPDAVKYDRSQAINVALDDQPLDFINAESLFRPLKEDESMEGEEEFTSSFDDAYRRDLTINSLMYNLQTDEIEDPTGKGLKDLQEGVINTIISPFIKYKIHATDLLRALRFASILGFELGPDMIEAMKQNAERLTPRDRGGDISNRRIRRELRKTIDDPSHWATMRQLLEQVGLSEILADDIKDVQADVIGGIEYQFGEEVK